ncbi:hypothetical protein [Salinicola sp. DM10]|uniref:hypothetical protein n=1 Tax=Salinicola sp. DM10 TaxID=2815721 RepID=UPI0004E74B5C|nr:hypothetical protein [Salinicola sp. DM10]KFF49962.1 hypothetical protein GY26_05255 [Gammaproteobacteria bacterium MFB021]MCE3026186.1 hypothetical protein [Salinicola sp. DM10]
MRKSLATIAFAALTLGLAGSALADSAALKDAQQANQEPLAPGSGVTASGEQDASSFSGGSAATNQSLDAMESETDGATNIEDSKSLDEINAEGHSVEAGDAIKSQ